MIPAAVIFDFDGTLADTAPDMTAALDHWLAVRQRPPADAAAARRLCSSGARVLLDFCGLNGEAREDSITEYLNYYEETGYRDTVLFDGVGDMLEQLNTAGVRWGVATNKPARFFAPIAERLLAPLRPAALVARDDMTLRAKPHPDILLAAVRDDDVPAACVYVGDDVRDAAASLAAGFKFVGVTWGYWRPEQWGNEETAGGTGVIALPIHALISQPALLTAAIAALG